MATNMSILEGEVNEDPAAQEINVEKMLLGFLRTLLEEQGYAGQPALKMGTTKGRS